MESTIESFFDGSFTIDSIPDTYLDSNYNHYLYYSYEDLSEVVQQFYFKYSDGSLDPSEYEDFCKAFYAWYYLGYSERDISSVGILEALMSAWDTFNHVQSMENLSQSIGLLLYGSSYYSGDYTSSGIAGLLQSLNNKTDEGNNLLSANGQSVAFWSWKISQNTTFLWNFFDKLLVTNWNDTGKGWFSDVYNALFTIQSRSSGLLSLAESINDQLIYLYEIRSYLSNSNSHLQSLEDYTSVIFRDLETLILKGPGSGSTSGSGKSLLDNIADIASAFSGDKSILGSLFNIEDLLSGGINIGAGGATYEQMYSLLLESHGRAYENSIYGYLKSLRDWSDEYQTTLFKNVSRYLFEANDEESVTVAGYLRMIYQVLKGREYSVYDGLLDKLDALYDVLSSLDPVEPSDLWGISAKLDAIIALLAADAAIDLADAILGNLDFTDLLSKLGGLGDVLASAFPFCLIFAIIAVLEVLAADPVAPSFDFAIPIGLNGETYHCAIDLMDYDGLATLVRYLLFAAYCIGLFMSTKDHIYSPSSGD